MFHGTNEAPFVSGGDSTITAEKRCTRPAIRNISRKYDSPTTRKAATPEDFRVALSIAQPGDTIEASGVVMKEPLEFAVNDLTVIGLVVRVERSDDAAVTVRRSTNFHNVRVTNYTGRAIDIHEGYCEFTECRATGDLGGIRVLFSRAVLTLTRCRLNGSDHGYGLDLAQRVTCIVDECELCDNGRGGINIDDYADPWIHKCTVGNNGASGIALNHAARAKIVDCEIHGNHTQGIFVGSDADGIVWKSFLHNGKASGVKALGRIAVEECTFLANADRDIDVIEDGNVTVSRCRFQGGTAQAVVLEGRHTQGTFKHNCFDQYNLWAFSAHEGARVRLERNFFNTAIDFDQAYPLDGDAGGSGLLLQYNVRGSAKENAFVGWRRGYVRSRVAFHINKCPGFRQMGAHDGLVDLQELRQESQVVYDELMEITHQNPNMVELDLSAIRLARRRKSSSTSTTSSEESSRKHQLDASSFETIMPILMCDSTLERINFAGNRMIGNEGVSTLAAAVAQHPSMESINLAGTGMTDVGTKAICQAAMSAPRLRELDLNKNDLGEDSVPVITEMLRTNRNIHKVHVEQNRRMKQEDLEDLDFFCAVNECATTNTRNQLISLHDAKDGNSLTRVNLSKQLMKGDDDDDINNNAAWTDPSRMIKMMCYSMRCNSWVTSITIDTSKIDDSALAHLGSFLQQRTVLPQLEQLSIAGNNIESVAPLCDAIQQSSRSNLRALDLSSNTLQGRENAEALRKLLGTDMINHLNIASNCFTPADINCIVFELPEGVKVRSEGQRPVCEDMDSVAPSTQTADWESRAGARKGDSSAAQPPATPPSKAHRTQMRVPQVFPLRKVAE